MRFIGLDLSLTATGLAADFGATWTIKSKAKGMQRLADLRGEIVFQTSHPAPATLVVVEDYAFSRGDAHSHALGELGGVVRLSLWEIGVPYVDVKASSLKRYATGKGNANKGQMIEAASKRSGQDFGGDDNRVDAWWLREMALDHYGLSEYTALPKVNRSSLDAVPWPVLSVAS